MKVTIVPLFTLKPKDTALNNTLMEIAQYAETSIGKICDVTRISGKTEQELTEAAKEAHPDFLLGITFEESGHPRDNYGLKAYTNVNGGIAELGAGYVLRELRDLHNLSNPAWTVASYKGVYETPINYRHARFLRQPNVPATIIVLGHAQDGLSRYFYSKQGRETGVAIGNGIVAFQRSGIRRAIQSETRIIRHDVV